MNRVQSAVYSVYDAATRILLVLLVIVLITICCQFFWRFM